MDPMERAKILRLLIEVARVTRRKRRAAARAPSGTLTPVTGAVDGSGRT